MKDKTKLRNKMFLMIEMKGSVESLDAIRELLEYQVDTLPMTWKDLSLKVTQVFPDQS